MLNNKGEKRLFCRDQEKNRTGENSYDEGEVHMQQQNGYRTAQEVNKNSDSSPLYHTMRKHGLSRRDAFETWNWSRMVRISWTARRTNASIIDEINKAARFIEICDLQSTQQDKTEGTSRKQYYSERPSVPEEKENRQPDGRTV